MDESSSATLLIGVHLTFPDSEIKFSVFDSLAELEELCNTAELDVIGKIIQQRRNFHIKHYVGKGKLEEIKEFIQENNINIVIADDELSPMQFRTMETELKIKVMDRTGLILDIFARQARTYESQLQVELAQLDYLMPRLTRMWTHLSRLGGGIGTRGPGEKQLEVDKRQIRKRMTTIQSKLNKISGQREIRRQKRHILPTITGAIVGYTNAGKSTLINALTGSDILAEDKLFATLDPTTRKLSLKSKEEVLLTDTVGFIQKLPHQLVSSFRATMEETIDADFLIRVIDASHPHFEIMIETANTILGDLNADQIPQLFVFNKIDSVSHINKLKKRIKLYQPHVCISAITKHGIHDLLDVIEVMLKKYRKIYTFNIPYNKMNIVSLIHIHSEILHEDYLEKSIEIKAEINMIIGDKIVGLLK